MWGIDKGQPGLGEMGDELELGVRGDPVYAIRVEKVGIGEVQGIQGRASVPANLTTAVTLVTGKHLYGS
jgi:hypothetical protein